MNNKNQKILVVDDVSENIDILMETLKSDYKVIAALNGEKALRLINSKNLPDLILLDIMMPEMNGYELCTRLKLDEKTRNIPVIFLSALSEEKDEAKGLQLGAVDYITKPFSPALVKARIRNHLELKRHRDHLEELVEARTFQLREANEKIKRASLDTIYRLSRAAEYKDQDTGFHIKRMSHYAALLASKLALDDPTVESLIYAVPMHDVGKIGIPDRILLKPGKLDDNEFEIMKQHTLIGARILENSHEGYIRLAEIIALTHHEKWDGSGYPNELKGPDIPLVGCITAIADVFDALMSKRPYKEPFPLDKSLHIIREGRGSHFHPEVVDVFFEVEKDILSIKEKYKEEEESLFLQMERIAA